MDAGQVHFFISGEDKQVFPGSRLWDLPLSGKTIDPCRDMSSNSGTECPDITIGDYFTAAGQFLAKNNFSMLMSGLAAVSHDPVQPDRIMVFLEKHGAFYHPLKIQVDLDGGHACFFVLNGAVSKPGLALIEKEYHLLSCLDTADATSFLPRVFGVDVLETAGGRVGFFLGEWFEGYKEFHATKDRGKREIVLWESDGSSHYISEAEAQPIYREAARILTHYYDIETFEQIFPWHHAAGDFIVRREKDNLLVRLITVRGYASLSEFPARGEDKKANILPSLLFFFLNLTIRMRLDRLNGTGPLVMLGQQTLPAIVDGFFQGLDEKSRIYDYGELKQAFTGFFQQFSLDQIMGMMEIVMDSHDPDASEMALVAESLKSHCHQLYSIFKNL